MTAGAQSYEAVLDVQTYIVPMRLQYVDFDELDDAQTSMDSFMDITPVKSGQHVVTVEGAGDTFAIKVNNVTMALNGTATPIQLLGLTGIPLSNDTTTDGATTLDQTTFGSQLNVATGNSSSFAVSGLTSRKNIDWKMLTILQERNASEQLVAKILRVGPSGSTEAKYGFIRVESFGEDGDAGSLSKWSGTFNFYGPVRTKLDNTGIAT